MLLNVYLRWLTVLREMHCEKKFGGKSKKLSKKKGSRKNREVLRKGRKINIDVN